MKRVMKEECSNMANHPFDENHVEELLRNMPKIKDNRNIDDICYIFLERRSPFSPSFAINIVVNNNKKVTKYIKFLLVLFYQKTKKL